MPWKSFEETVEPARRTLRVAVIGCGPIGLLHARAIAASPSAELAAVCDISPHHLAEAVAAFHVDGYETVKQLLESQPLDVVMIATPDHLHVEPTLAAIAAGCHVFCEKPLATNTAEARRLVQAANEQGVYLGVDYNRRFAFGYQTAKQLLDQGNLDRLEYLTIRVSDATPPPEVARHPLVMLTTLLTHHFDLMRFYAGEVAQVHAVAGRHAPGELAKTLVITLQFTSGAVGSLVGAYRNWQSRTSEWAELGGKAASIVVEDITRRVVLVSEDPDRTHVLSPDLFAGGDAFYDSLTSSVQAFIDQLARGAAPPVTGEDALASLRLVDAVTESLASGQIVEVKS